MKTITVVLITDSNQIMPVVVTITSIIENRNKSRNYKIFVIGVELSESEKEMIESLGGDSVSVEVLIVENKYKTFESSLAHVTSACNFKFDIPAIFKDLERVLYLDTDIIVQSDLCSLFDIDMTDKYAAVVKDMHGLVSGDSEKRTGCPDYFNAGMMLLNLKKMNEDDCCARMNETRKKYGDMCVDQDTQNRVLGKNCIYLPPKYNFQTNNFMHTEKSLREFYHLEKDGKVSPGNSEIIHYTWLKPWKYKYIPLAKNWIKYYKKTCFASEKLDLKYMPTDRFYKSDMFKYFYSVCELDDRIVYRLGKIKLTKRKKV